MTTIKKFTARLLAIIITIALVLPVIPFDATTTVRASGAGYVTSNYPAGYAFALETNYRYLPYITVELENHNTQLAMENLVAHFENSGDSSSTAFEIVRGFSPGMGDAPYNSHNQIPPNVVGEVPIVNIRVGVRANLPIGSYNDTLVITRSLVGGGREVISEIPLTATVSAHVGVRPSIRNVNFGNVEEGFGHAHGLTVSSAAGRAGPWQIHLRNLSTRTPIYLTSPNYPYERIIDFVFDGDISGTSPFILYRDVNGGTSATYTTGVATNILPATNANSANIRIAVRQGLPPGHYVDFLRMVGPVGFDVGTAGGVTGDFVRVEVTIVPHPADRLTLPAIQNPFVFPERAQGYTAFLNASILATTINPESNNARQFNFRNPSAVPITGLHAEFDTNYFEFVQAANGDIFRLSTSTGTSATAQRWLNYAPPNNDVNLRVRPVAGLEPGTYTDTLRIFSDRGSAPIAEIPVSFTVTDWLGNGFQFSVRATRFPGGAVDNFLLIPENLPTDPNVIPVTAPLVFPDRIAGYAAFTTGISVANSSLAFSHRAIWLTNLRTDTAVEGLVASWASVDDGIFSPATAPFVITRGLHRDTTAIGIANPSASDRMEANNALGTSAGGSINIMVAPRHRLFAGTYQDILRIRGDHGFAVDIPVSFTVTGRDEGVTIYPTSAVIAPRERGYAFPGSSNATVINGGWQEFIVANNTPYNYEGVRVTWETGGIFRLNRGLAWNTLQNHHASTTVRTVLTSRLYSTASIPHTLGVRIWPANGLGVGVHTDTMIIEARDPNCTAIYAADFVFIELTRATISFEVLPQAQLENFNIEPNSTVVFPPRLMNYVLPNDSNGWMQVTIRNNMGAGGNANLITNLAANLQHGEGTFFRTHTPLSTSSVAGNNSAATIRIWPQLGLPPGTHTDTLVFTGYRGGVPFRVDVPLIFRVYQADFSVRAYGRNYTQQQARTNNTRFEWHPRYFGHGHSASIWPHTLDNLANTMRTVEFIVTNHTGVHVSIPPSTAAGMADFNAFSTPYFMFSRTTRYSTSENTDAATTMVSVIAPGASVGVRLVPSLNLPVGRHTDTFHLRDINGVPLVNIDLAVEIMDWSGLGVTPVGQSAPRWSAQIAGSQFNWSAASSPNAARPAPYVRPSSGGLNPVIGTPVTLPVFEIPSQNQGYVLPEPTTLAMHVPIGQLYNPTWGNVDIDHASGNIAIYFEGGPDGTGWEGFQTGHSQFFDLTMYQIAGSTVAQSPRNVASIRPVEGLPVGIYEDVLVFRSRVTNYNAGTMDAQRFIIFVPVRFEVLPHELEILPTMPVLPNEPNDHADTIRVFYQFPSMPRVYTIGSHHAANITIRNLGSSPIGGLTAEFVYDQSSIVQYGPHSGQIAFSIMNPPGFFSTTPQASGVSSHILGAYPNGQIGISLWPRNMLPTGIHYAVVRISDGADFHVYIHLSFEVDMHNVSFPEPVVFDPVFAMYQMTNFQYIAVDIESFETAHSIHAININPLVNSPFRIDEVQRLQTTGGSYTVLPWASSLGAGDTLRIILTQNEDFPNLTTNPIIHTDTLRVEGGDFIRNIPISFEVYEVSVEVTAPSIGITTHVDVVEIPPQRTGNTAADPVGIRIRNTNDIPFTGLSAGAFLTSTNYFEIVTPLNTTEILPDEFGVIYVRPLPSAAVGLRTATLVFTGDLGFELEIEINFGMFEFEVEVIDYPRPPRLIDPEWLNDPRFGSTSPVPRIPDLSRIQGYTSVFTAPFRVSMDCPIGSERVRMRMEGSVNAFNNGLTFGYVFNTAQTTRTILVTPRTGLPVGVHTAYLVFYIDGYGELERVPLVFEVLARQPYMLIGESGDFGTKSVDYYELPYNVIAVRNQGVSDVGGLTAVIRLSDGREVPVNSSESNFVVSNLQPTTILGTLWGCSCGCSIAEVNVRPRTGLPIGVYSEHLIIRGTTFPASQSVYFAIPLTFEVVDVLAPVLEPLENVFVLVGDTGDTHPMTVIVTSTANGSFSFQWQSSSSYNGVFTNIAGATSATLNAPIDVVGRIYYRVIVTDTWGEALTTRTASTTSNVAFVQVNDFTHAQPPIITTHPQSATVTVGQVGDTHTLTVVANSPDGGVLTYQWYREVDGVFVPIYGATNTTLEVCIATEGVNRFRVVVTNYLATATGNRIATAVSETATITVDALINAQTPIITEHPQSATVDVGLQTVTLNVVAHVTDGGVLSYQWERATGAYGGDFEPIYGATGTSLLVDTNSVGVNRYRVVVTNYLTTATGNERASTISNVAVVTVLELTHAPTPELSGPDNYTTDRRPTGTTHPLTVVATITPPERGTLSFQWQRADTYNGVFTDIAGATSATFNAPIDTDGRIYYRVIVTNTWPDATGNTTAIATSNVAFVHVTALVPTSIVITPYELTIQQGFTHTFTAVVYDQLGNPYANQAVTWTTAAVSADYVASGTTVTNGLIQIAMNQPIGTITLTVASNVAPAISDYAVIEVITRRVAPEVTISPMNPTIDEGDDITFTVTIVAGYPVPTLQWQVLPPGAFEWDNIPNETGTTLSYTNVPFSMNGYRFRVRAVNSEGIGYSTFTTLTVIQAALPPSQAPVIVPLLLPTILQAGAGAPVTLQVDATVTDGGTLSFQWQMAEGEIGFDFYDIVGATNDTLNFNASLTVGSANRYRVIVTNTTAGSTPTSTTSSVTIVVTLASLSAPLAIVVSEPEVEYEPEIEVEPEPDEPETEVEIAPEPELEVQAKPEPEQEYNFGSELDSDPEE
ncbi:MAG: hypothetical protein FWC89_01250 [Defluviitaleaceae bacterium]|nr:hypothetical protein [Defluviitaleaceae bacterium]